MAVSVLTFDICLTLCFVNDFSFSESDPMEQLIESVKTNQWVGDETLVALLEKPLLR